jgi:hypothetical protein
MAKFSPPTGNLPEIEIRRAPVGLAALLEPYAVTVATLKSQLERHRSGVRYELAGTDRSLNARALTDTIVVSSAVLNKTTEILNLDGVYYLRFKDKPPSDDEKEVDAVGREKVGASGLPVTTKIALLQRPLALVLAEPGTPADPTITVIETQSTSSDDELFRLDWPLAPC